MKKCQKILIVFEKFFGYLCNMRLEGYSNYEIDPEAGTVWSYKRNKYIGTKGKNGYLRVGMYSDDGKEWRVDIHRVIWVAVNGEIPEGMQVNHINENKDDNSISNLNLMTPKENNNWGTRNERVSNKLSKPIVALKNGNPHLFFVSSIEASKKGFIRKGIYACCIGERNTHKGYQWKYLDDVLGDWLEEIQDEDMKKERVA